MPDNWPFVIAAYGLAAIVLALYWRFLVRRDKELDDARVVRRELREASGASGLAQAESRPRSPLP